MLLTDGSPNTTEDLRVYESAILGVAKTEAIDLDVKLGLATEEVSLDTLDFLVNRGRRETGVSDVVVTRQMKRWHALHTLGVFYRDAFHNQLNDRYKAKFFEYKFLARRAREQTFSFGVGVVNDPIPIAQRPEFSFAEGPFPETVYYVQVAWASALGQVGARSPATTYAAPAGSVPVVVAVNPPENAVGFHVYVGLTPEAITRQTSAPVETFTLPSTGLIEGAAVDDGQEPDFYVTGGSLMLRG